MSKAEIVGDEPSEAHLEAFGKVDVALSDYSFDVALDVLVNLLAEAAVESGNESIVLKALKDAVALRVADRNYDSTVCN